jgi:esterase/lipase
MNTDSLQPPPRSGLIREARGVLELPRLFLRFPSLARQPRGNGQPVLIIPGYGAGDASTALLKTYLRYLGYQVRGWGRGGKSRDVPELLRRAIKRVISFAHKSQQTVQIVGWSLGGYLAREAARDLPDLVQQVITLGTPVIGGPKYTVFADMFRSRGIDVEAIASEIEVRSRVTLDTPVTAIYSRMDGVVTWEACIDHQGSNVEHIEVTTSHLGFGFSPDVYKIIAQRLATGAAASHPKTAESPSGRKTRRLLRRKRH